MKTVCLIGLFCSMFLSPAHGTALDQGIPDESRASCAELLGLVKRLVLPGTLPGHRYPSGLTYGGPAETPRWIATFFASARAGDQDRIVSELARADTGTRLLFLHRLGLAFAQIAPHLITLMNGPQNLFPGQDDGPLVRLLAQRSAFVEIWVLPLVFERADVVQPQYFDELVTIAADLANVPGAYRIAVDIVHFLEPHLDAHRRVGGRLGGDALARIKFHALANHSLEDPHVDRDAVRRALDHVGTILRPLPPVTHLAWLTPQLAYWIQLGLTVQGNAEVFARAKFVAGLLADELPHDARARDGAAMQVRRDVAALLAGLKNVPELLTSEQTRGLRGLTLVH